jgi:hypothetical protein
MYFGYNNKEDLKDAVVVAAGKLCDCRICLDVFKDTKWTKFECFNDLVCYVVADSQYWNGDYT